MVAARGRAARAGSDLPVGAAFPYSSEEAKDRW